MAEVAQRIADGTDKLSKSAERSAEAITKAERAVRTAEDSIAFSNGQKIALLKTIKYNTPFLKGGCHALA